MKLLKNKFKASTVLTAQQKKRYNNLKYTMNKMGIKNNIGALNNTVNNTQEYAKAIQKMEYGIERARISKLKETNKAKGLKREYDFYKSVDKDKANKVQKQLIKETAKQDIMKAKSKIKDVAKRKVEVDKITKKAEMQLRKNEKNREAIEYNKLLTGSVDGKNIQNKQGLSKKINDVAEYERLRKSSNQILAKQFKELKKTDRASYDYISGNIPTKLGKGLVDVDKNYKLMGKDDQAFKNLIDTKDFANNVEFYNMVENSGFSISSYLDNEKEKVADVFMDKRFSYKMKPGLGEELYTQIVSMDMISYKIFYDRFGGANLGQIYAEMISMDEAEINYFIQEKIDYIKDLKETVSEYYK